MNLIESLKTDIKASKHVAWGNSDRVLLNQITIMEALLVLLEKAGECKQCGGSGWMEEYISSDPKTGYTVAQTIPCGKCNADGKKRPTKKEQT